jgi:Family of unknown function (DUF6263)
LIGLYLLPEDSTVARRAITAALVVFLGLASQAPAQDVQLKWEFQKDKPIYQEMTTNTKQSMDVMGQKIDQNNMQRFVFSWTPKEQDKDKNWIIAQKLEAVMMKTEIGGSPTEYDSTAPAAAGGNALGEFFKALVGSEFKLTISPDLKVIKIDGRDEFVSKLVRANPQMEAILKQILGDEALKQMADPAFAAIPPKPVKKGDTWEKKLVLNMGPIGTYDTTNTYTYDGKDGKLDKIKVDTKLKYAAPGAAAAGALPFKIKAGTELVSKSATGTIYFDNEKHRLDHSDAKLNLEGKLDIDVGGTSTQVNLTMEQTTTVKMSDTNPVPTAKKS